MKIEKMTQSKNVPDRWYLELDNGETLKVNLSIIAEFSLFSGRELSGEEVTALCSAAGKMNAKARALRILGTRSMSEKELSEKLLQKGEEKDDVNEAVLWLRDMGYLDDKKYAGMIVRHYMAKGYGARKISEELYRRGIERELRDEAMQQIDGMEQSAEKILRKKFANHTPDKKEIKKATDMLLRRGFSWSEIHSVLCSINVDTEEN